MAPAHMIQPAAAAAAAAALVRTAGINLFDEASLPERTLVVLSGCDLLCPALHVRHWLETKTRAQVLYNPTCGEHHLLACLCMYVCVLVDLRQELISVCKS
jgi:hypothetical protein